MIVRVECTYEGFIYENKYTLFNINNIKNLETNKTLSYVRTPSAFYMLPILNTHQEPISVIEYQGKLGILLKDSPDDYSNKIIFYLIPIWSIYRYSAFKFDWESVDYYNNFYFKYLDEVSNT